MTAILAE